jgi:hypothetical protein
VKALDDLKSAPSLTLAGTLSDKGQPETVSFGIARNGCINTVNMGSKGTMTMIMVGKSAWMKADAAFWKSNGGADAGMLSGFVGKYVKMPADGGGAASGAATCSVSQLTSSSSQVPLSEEVIKGALTTVDGQRVYSLLHKDKTEDDTMYVTDTSTPRLIEVVGKEVSKGGTSGRFTVTYGVPGSVTAPPASQTTAFPSLGS